MITSMKSKTIMKYSRNFICPSHHYPVPPWHTPRNAPGPKHLHFFTLSVQMLCSLERKCDIDQWALWQKPVKDNCSIVLVRMLTNQNQIHILIHKLIHIIYTYWLNIFTAKATQILRGEHSTRPLGDTCQIQMCGTHTKMASKCPVEDDGEGRVE